MLIVACAFFVLLLSSIDCLPLNNDSSKNGTKIKPGTFIAGYPRDFWNETQLNVCFEKREIAYQMEYSLVEKAIRATWEKELSPSLKFVFLSQACDAVGSSTPRHIRIQVDNAARPHSYVGAYLKNKPNGMVLNFLFTGWETSYCTANKYDNSPIFGRILRRHFCVAAIAVHEFGHALGFWHENQREDTPKACLEAQAKIENVSDTNLLIKYGMLLASQYDKNSVMNYCNLHWNNDGTLSACDRYGVIKVYRKYDDQELAKQCLKSVGLRSSN